MSKTLGPTKPCPCGAKDGAATYGECCRPYHRGEREAPSAEALMRSRYSAFALGEAEYLLRTLSDDHPDRAHPETALLAALREVCRSGRFLGLKILEAREDGDTAVVRFFARLFTKGKDQSFEETSEFRRTNGAWRYSGATEATAKHDGAT